MKIFTFAITLHKKTHMLCFKCNKQKPFSFRLPSMLFYYFSRSSAVPLAIFPPETPGISLLRNHPSHVAIWAPDPYMKACLWNIKSVHTHFSPHSETWRSSTGCQRAPPRPPATPAPTPTRTPDTSTAGPRASPRPPATPAPTPTCTPAHRAGGPPRPLGPPAPPPHREYGFHDFRPRPYHPAPPREGYGYAGPGPHLLSDTQEPGQLLVQPH